MKVNKKCVSRRSFLKRSAAVGLPFIVPASVFGKNSPANRVNVACIGTGNQGVHDMRGIMQNDDVQIVAVCDINTGSRGYAYESQFLGREPARQIVDDYYAGKKGCGSYKGCVTYTDFREVLERSDVDAVTIVTPDHWHATMAVMAARAGKDIYCEKPLALTVKQGRAIVEAARRYKVVFQTGTHHRSSENIRRVCELVRNGRIGKLKRMVTVLGPHSRRFMIKDWEPMAIPAGFDYDMWLGPAPKAPYHKDRCLYRFRFLTDYAGGEATNTGAHCFDIAQWANGSDRSGPVEVRDLGGEFPSDGMYDTACVNHFAFTYADGVELLCKPSREKGERRYAVRFEGAEGWIETGWGGQGFRASTDAIAKSLIRPTEVRLYQSGDHYRNWLDCIKSRKETITPAEVGHRSATLCHLGNIAMTLGRKLAWDPEMEIFTNDDEANRMLTRPMRSPWRV